MNRSVKTPKKPTSKPAPSYELERMLRCIHMAMGCISPLSRNYDERLAWYRLLDAIEGREPRQALEHR